MISDKLDKVIREVPNFPKPGINFKDITTILLDSELSTEIIDAFINRLKGKVIDAIVGVVKACQKTQQPVLVGTSCIESSESISLLLKKALILHISI